MQVAAAAGFTGIGLRAEDYLAARRSGLDDRAMQAILDHHGVGLCEVELLDGWCVEGGPTAAQREKERTVLHLARTFGADHANAALFQQRPLDAVPGAFAALCDRAGDVRIALEFMPFSGLPTLAHAWEVVRRADRPSAGLLVDAWHWSRSGSEPEVLAPVPTDRIAAIQLSDVGEHPMADLREETLHHRLAPGRGFGPVAAMVSALQAKGVDAMVSVEVMSDELLARGPAVIATEVMAAAREVLWASEVRSSRSTTEG